MALCNMLDPKKNKGFITDKVETAQNRVSEPRWKEMSTYMREDTSCNPQRQIKRSLKELLNFRIRTKSIYDKLGTNCCA